MPTITNTAAGPYTRVRIRRVESANINDGRVTDAVELDEWTTVADSAGAWSVAVDDIVAPDCLVVSQVPRGGPDTERVVRPSGSSSVALGDLDDVTPDPVPSTIDAAVAIFNASRPRIIPAVHVVNETQGFGSPFDPETDPLPVPIPAGLPIVTYTPAAGDPQEGTARQWVSAGQGELLTGGRSILGPATFMSLLVAQEGGSEEGGGESPFVRVVATEDGERYYLAPLP